MPEDAIACTPPPTLSPVWQQWVAKALLNNDSEETIVASIMSNGYSKERAEHILQSIKDNPLLSLSRSYKDILNRRQWLLMTLGELGTLSENCKTIERRVTPPFKTFVSEYYAPNRPVILTDAIEHWPAITPENLLADYGDAWVEVQMSRSTNPRYEQESYNHKKKILFREFISQVLETDESNDFYMTANNASSNASTFSPLLKSLPNIGDGYLDLSRMEQQGFLWFGPKGIVTPLHHDLTNNLIVQLQGRKRFHMIPSWQAPVTYNETHVFSQLDLRNLDLEKHPMVSNATILTFDLNPGEALFIPIGWWHQVEGLDINLSFSCTNFNAPNNFMPFREMPIHT
jgi:hypothetical protein